MNTVSPATPGRLDDLSGMWHFQIDQDDCGEAEQWFHPSYDHATWGRMPVPGAWDWYEPAFWGYEGIAWFATTFDPELVQPDLWQRLHFTAVNIHARIWLNGVLLGEHTGGYLPFEFAVSPHLRTDGSNLLVVRVDNVPRAEWLPGTTTIEWVQYGGILQPVQLLTTTPVFVERLRVTAIPEGNGAYIRCDALVMNAGNTGWRAAFCGVGPITTIGAISLAQITRSCGRHRTARMVL